MWQGGREGGNVEEGGKVMWGSREGGNVGNKVSREGMGGRREEEGKKRRNEGRKGRKRVQRDTTSV